MALAHTDRTFVPAMGLDWLLPIYDPLTNLMGLDRVRRDLVDRATVRPHHRVLDVGCGTGSLAILIKRVHPEVEVVAVDPDPRALARARRKADRAGVSVRFDPAFSDALPYVDASYDRVFSSFMFHHLERDEKAKTLDEVRRVLKPGGRLHLVDFAGADPDGHGAGALLHSHRRLEDNRGSRVIDFMRAAGLLDARSVAERGLLAGHLRITYYEASAPDRAGAPPGSAE